MALSDRALESIAPLAGNWAGIEDSLDIKKPCHQPQPGAARFETTRCSRVLAGCFAQALQLMEAAGIDWIHAQIAQRHDFLEQMADMAGLRLLSGRDGKHRAGIAVIEAPGATAIAHMVDAGFIVTRHDDVRVRVSMHASTQLDSLRELVSVLAA